MSATTRRALLVGVERYDDDRFAALPSCRADVWEMQQVLRQPAIGSFDVVIPLYDPTAAQLRQAISEFLEEAGPDDLSLLFISGHGLRLRYSTGEFHFVARDTDADRLEETAVSAGFVNEQLEACRAPRKVTIIDACESGGFALGLRTRDAKAPAQERATAPLQSRGVYVLSSSGAGEASYAGPATGAAPAPSLFTGEIVRALRDGTADSDGDGKVSVVDLFNEVSGRVRSQERPTRQVPVYSAIGVNSQIIIANVVAGGSIRLEPVPAATPAAEAVLQAMGAAPVPSGRTAQWRRLVDYYQRCLRIETLEMPLLRPRDEGGRFICLSGRERILSGGENDQDHIVLDGKDADWCRRVAASEDELWAGYPAVVLYGSADRPDGNTRFAPLIVRRVEIADDDAGLRLVPVGPAQPHPQLAREWLGDEQADQLLATYYASWHAGGYAQMTRDLRELLTTEFELPMVQELRPEFLDGGIDLRTPTMGARNVALLYRVPRDDRMIGKLLEDLTGIGTKADKIAGTALEALLAPEQAAASTAGPVLVTPLPCNDSQRRVIESAMTSRLTVATGPPGSGKSQLVANAVATAVANGQKVLVASTNNTAVDEVWQRCRALLPGLLIRSGNRSYMENESAELIELAALEKPSLNVLTAGKDLHRQSLRTQDTRKRLATVADLEQQLLDTARQRESLAAALLCSTGDLARALGGPKQLVRLQRRAGRCAKARILARWRRARLLRGLPVLAEPTAETCRALSRFAGVEQGWARLKSDATRLPGDSALSQEADETEAAFRSASLALADAVVRTYAVGGRRQIAELLQTKKEPRSDWGAASRVLAAARGWALSSLSARRFPLDAALFDLVIVDEASQCSIPQVLPLLFRARRALVIGDPMQLQHITKLTPQRESAARRAAGLKGGWLEDHRLSYRRHSAFHAAEHAARQSLLLDEHYRCHPRIADLINRQFYGGRLTVLTDIRGRQHLDQDPIAWSPVDGRLARPSQGSSWTNAKEVAKVNEWVRYVVKKLPDATIGVVTPYKAQSDRIARSWTSEPRIRVGTVHTFQGGERDVMIFGLVGGRTMPGASIGWLEGERNLWNVAISRARSNLVVVGDKDFWDGRRGIGGALAAADSAPVEETADDPLLDRLYDLLIRTPDAKVELVAVVNGHHCDALVSPGDGPRNAVLLDRGTPEGDLAGHLRLQYRRLALLTSPDEGAVATRLPAWRLYDDEQPSSGT